MNNSLYAGSAESILPLLDDCSIDLTLFSPPYDKIRNYNGFTFNLHTIGKEVYRICKDGGVVCIVIQDGTKDFAKSITTAHLIVDWVDNIGFKLFETVIYNRDGRPGAWWSKRFRVDHEYILMFFKGKKPNTFHKEHLKIPSKYAGHTFHGTQRHTDGSLTPIKSKIQADTKCRGTVWKYDSSKSERNKTKLKHPATFPDKLAEDLVLTFTNVGDVVLDPMCGSGTTLCMSKKNNRDSIGIDISPEYVEIAKELLGE